MSKGVYTPLRCSTSPLRSIYRVTFKWMRWQR